MKIFKYKHKIKTKRRMFSIGGESLLSRLAWRTNPHSATACDGDAAAAEASTSSIGWL